MRKRATRESWQEWVDHHKVRWGQMLEAGINMREIWPKKNGIVDLGLFEALAYSLGLPWNESKVSTFVDPDLYH